MRYVLGDRQPNEIVVNRIIVSTNESFTSKKLFFLFHIICFRNSKSRPFSSKANTSPRSHPSSKKAEYIRCN